MGKLDSNVARDTEDFKPVPLPKQEKQHSGKEPTRGVGPKVTKRVARKRIKHYYRKSGSVSLKKYARSVCPLDENAVEWMKNKCLR